MVKFDEMSMYIYRLESNYNSHEIDREIDSRARILFAMTTRMVRCFKIGRIGRETISNVYCAMSVAMQV